MGNDVGACLLVSASRRPTLASKIAATRSSWSSSSSMIGSGSSDASVGSSTPLDQIKAAMKTKEKVMLFIDHNGSLLRRQPGAGRQP